MLESIKGVPGRHPRTAKEPGFSLPATSPTAPQEPVHEEEDPSE